MGVEAAGTSMCLEESGNPYLSKTSRMRGSPMAAEWTSCLEYMEENKAFCPRGSSAPKAQGSNVKCLNMLVPHGQGKVHILCMTLTGQGHKKRSAHQQAPQAAFDVLSLMQQQDTGRAEWVCTPCEWEVLRLWMAGTACPVHCTFYSQSRGCRNPEVNTINKAKACPFHPSFLPSTLFSAPPSPPHPTLPYK